MILCSSGCSSSSVQHAEIHIRLNLNIPQVKAKSDEIQELQSPKNHALRREKSLVRKLCYQKDCMDSKEVNIA